MKNKLVTNTRIQHYVLQNTKTNKSPPGVRQNASKKTHTSPAQHFQNKLVPNNSQETVQPSQVISGEKVSERFESGMIVICVVANKGYKELNDLLFHQLESFLEDNLEKFKRHKMRVSVIGEISRLPRSLQEAIKRVEDRTDNNEKVELIFAVSYGGRRDVTQAIRKIGEKTKACVVEPQDIDGALIEKELWTNISGRAIPDPDLLIRTGGDFRVSDFMLWQMAYTELYLTDVYWPDFGEVEFVKALESFQNRNRVFGN